jgi:hypothetical protein
LLPSLLKLRGAEEGKRELAEQSTAASSPLTTTSSNSLQKAVTLLQDPFNLAIVTGIVLALTGTPVTKLGFFGNALKSLAACQTPVLFLLIGLKLKFNGAALPLCGSLLLARHGFTALFTALYLKLVLPLYPSGGGNVAHDLIATRNNMRLLATLCSQAACSVIAYAQINKVEKSNPKMGYNSDLSFDLVALSFPFAILLNTITILIGSCYVNALGRVGALMCSLSGLCYLTQKKLIDSL